MTKYICLTGNQEYAAVTQKESLRPGSTMVPCFYNPAVDELSWGVYEEDGDEIAKGPFPIRETSGTERRKLMRELGAIADAPKTELAQLDSETKSIRNTVNPEPLTLPDVTSKIMGLQKKSIRNFVEIGRWLNEAKKLVGYGNWLNYLQNEVFLSEYQAQACMKMFADWGANPHLIEDLNFTKVNLVGQAPPEAWPALIELAKSAPTSAVEMAVRATNRGAAPSESKPPTQTEQPIGPSSLPPSPAPPSPEPAPDPMPAPPVTSEPTTASPIQTKPATPDAKPEPTRRAPAPNAKPAKTTKAPPRIADSQPAAPVDPRQHQEEIRQAALHEQAMKFNMGIRDLLNVVTSIQGLTETTSGAADCGGDYIVLDTVYAVLQLLPKIHENLQRVVRECARQKGE